MKRREPQKHPGPFRGMRVDSEFAGLLLAAGFLVMGAVGLDIGKFFVLGAFSLGLAIALVLRFMRRGG
ncbi:MAG: hypothetical protein WBV36_02995 [Terriglobales bacterium]